MCRYWPKAEMDSVLYEFWKEYRNIVFYFKFLTIFTVAGLQFKTSKKCHPKMGTLNVKVPKVPAIILICFLEKRQPGMIHAVFYMKQNEIVQYYLVFARWDWTNLWGENLVTLYFTSELEFASIECRIYCTVWVKNKVNLSALLRKDGWEVLLQA